MKNNFDNTNALLRLHEFVSQEITRYRDIQWQVPSILIAFLLAFFTGLNVERVSSAIEQNLILRILLTCLCFLMFFLELFFIIFTQNALRRQYNLLMNVEKLLKLSDIIKKSKITPTAKVKGIGRIWRVINLVAIEVLVGLVILAMILIMIWYPN